MTKSDVSRKKVSFQTQDSTERTEVFKHLCEQLSLDLKPTKKKVGATTAIGLQHIFELSKQQGLIISVNFSDNVASVVYTPSNRELELETTIDNLSNFEKSGVERKIIAPIEEDPIPHIQPANTVNKADEKEEEEIEELSNDDLDIDTSDFSDDDIDEEIIDDEELDTELDFENDDFEPGDEADDDLDF